MWPFKKKVNPSKERYFLISESMFKELMEEHTLYMLLKERMEYHNGEFILPVSAGEAIAKSMETVFPKAWDDLTKDCQERIDEYGNRVVYC